MSWRSSFSASPSPAFAVRISIGCPSVSGTSRSMIRPSSYAVPSRFSDLVAVQDTNGQRRTGEAGADIGGEVGSGGAVGKLTDRAVGKGDAHGSAC